MRIVLLALSFVFFSSCVSRGGREEVGRSVAQMFGTHDASQNLPRNPKYLGRQRQDALLSLQPEPLTWNDHLLPHLDKLKAQLLREDDPGFHEAKDRFNRFVKDLPLPTDFRYVGTFVEDRFYLIEIPDYVDYYLPGVSTQMDRFLYAQDVLQKSIVDFILPEYADPQGEFLTAIANAHSYHATSPFFRSFSFLGGTREDEVRVYSDDAEKRIVDLLGQPIPLPEKTHNRVYKLKFNPALYSLFKKLYKEESALKTIRQGLFDSDYVSSANQHPDVTSNLYRGAQQRRAASYTQKNKYLPIDMALLLSFAGATSLVNHTLHGRQSLGESFAVEQHTYFYISPTNKPEGILPSRGLLGDPFLSAFYFWLRTFAAGDWEATSHFLQPTDATPPRPHECRGTHSFEQKKFITDWWLKNRMFMTERSRSIRALMNFRLYHATYDEYGNYILSAFVDYLARGSGPQLGGLRTLFRHLNQFRYHYPEKLNASRFTIKEFRMLVMALIFLDSSFQGWDQLQEIWRNYTLTFTGNPRMPPSSYFDQWVNPEDPSKNVLGWAMDVLEDRAAAWMSHVYAEEMFIAQLPWNAEKKRPSELFSGFLQIEDFPAPKPPAAVKTQGQPAKKDPKKPAPVKPKKN